MEQLLVGAGEPGEHSNTWPKKKKKKTFSLLVPASCSLTFADIDPAQINLTDGAFPRGPFGSATAFQVHNIGEVWASALFEVRARFIARLGYAAGNQRFLQIVTDGMKLDPVNPTLLQGRDSILAAAAAASFSSAADLFADTQDVWAGFATRGMGYSAQVTNAGVGSVVEAFDLPGIAANGGTVIAESIPNGRLDPGESATVSLCIINLAASASGSVSGSLQATGGVLSPSGTQVFGLVASQTSICRTYTLIVGASCGGTMTATLQAQEAGGTTRNLTYIFPVGAVGVETFDAVTAPALPAGWTTATLSGTPNVWATSGSSADTAPNRAFAANPGTISDNVLLSPVIALPATNSIGSFRNFYNTESTFDGGVLEISIAGGAFVDIITAGGSFVTGGYNGTLSASFGNPIGGRQAWTGNSLGYITSSVNLPVAANGQNIQFRWRIGTDNLVAAAGWSIDQAVVFTACANQAPVITTQPISQTVTSGTSVGLSVYAAGTAPLSYQWYIGASGDTSNPVVGATASSYLTPPLAVSTAYWVRVTNPVSFANSATATLTIGPGAGAEMIANGDFSQPFPSGWAMFQEPDITTASSAGCSSTIARIPRRRPRARRWSSRTRAPRSLPTWRCARRSTSATAAACASASACSCSTATSATCRSARSGSRRAHRSRPTRCARTRRGLDERRDLLLRGDEGQQRRLLPPGQRVAHDAARPVQLAHRLRGSDHAGAARRRAGPEPARQRRLHHRRR